MRIKVLNMEVKMYQKQLWNAAVVAVTIGVMAVGGGIGASAVSAAPSSGEAWEMGDYRGELLQRAVDDVIANAGDQNVEFFLGTRGVNQEIYNYTNWIVCWQSPSADDSVEVGDEPESVSFEVARPISGC